MQRVLLHACCAVCAGYPVELLINDGFSPVIYFYNPNIYPAAEHDRRLFELVKYSKKKGCELIYDNYSPDDFENGVCGLEKEPEKGMRCTKCFELRLGKTALLAKKMGIKLFTTTLSVSPHKRSGQIFEAGEEAAAEHGLEFLKYDFKKRDGFKITSQIARENGMYAQTYCGCRYSIRKESAARG